MAGNQLIWWTNSATGKSGLLFTDGGDPNVAGDGAKYGLTNDPTCCCTATTCQECAGQFPDELTATLTVIGGACVCVEGETITLFKVAANDPNAFCDSNAETATGDDLPRWQGSKVICGTTVSMCLAPCGLPPGHPACGVGEFPWKLLIDSGSTTIEGECVTADNCNPVLLVFDSDGSHITNLCAVGGQLRTTITP